MPQCTDLFQSQPAGPCHWTVPRGIVPPGIPRHRVQGIDALLGAHRCLRRGGCHQSDLPQARTAMKTDLSARVDAIVIGASAGGVEGLSLLLPALPASMRAAVFIVMHLPRDHRSMLSDLYAPHCAIAVKEAEDKEPVRPATVYFAPPDYRLLLDDGPQIALSVDEPVHFSR